MNRLPLMLTVAAAALCAGDGWHPAMADPYSSAGQTFEYGPYNGQNSGSRESDSNFQYRGAESPPPDTAANPSYDAAPAAGQSYRSDTGQGWNPDANSSNNRAVGSMGDAYSPSRNGPAPEPPPPGAAEGPPPRDLGGGLPRVEVQAAAPDDGVPYAVREHDARRAAIDGWRGKVSDQYGPEFSHWGLAAGKHVDCHPDRRDGIICTASGQPVRGFDRYGETPADRR
ncbi:MAG: hypothetical protein JSR99_09350 [Proteobacteria bacterium]|nr:hypothetical protein [Pseudomonadota bacterium]